MNRRAPQQGKQKPGQVDEETHLVSDDLVGVLRDEVEDFGREGLGSEQVEDVVHRGRLAHLALHGSHAVLKSETETNKQNNNRKKHKTRSNFKKLEKKSARARERERRGKEKKRRKRKTMKNEHTKQREQPCQQP